MPFSAGELCCAMDACVLIDTSSTTPAAWDKIPHVTEISFNLQANTPKLVTSSTGGQETSLCGTLTQSGTLSVACHKGTAPGFLFPNQVYHIAWSSDCTVLWDFVNCTVKNTFDGDYFEAYIRITALPVSYNISGNQATVYQYGFDIVSWVLGPDSNMATPKANVTEGFVC